MNKFYETITNNRGDVLPGYLVQVVTSAGASVSIYEDNSGTQFTDSAGAPVNYATADLAGLVEFYWTPATGHILQVLDPDGNNIEAVYHGEAKRSAASVKVEF